MRRHPDVQIVIGAGGIGPFELVLAPSTHDDDGDPVPARVRSDHSAQFGATELPSGISDDDQIGTLLFERAPQLCPVAPNVELAVRIGK